MAVLDHGHHFFSDTGAKRSSPITFLLIWVGFFAIAYVINIIVSVFF